MPSRPKSDAGFTLIEVLIAVAILGLAFAALLGGIAVSVSASDLHRKQAAGHVVLVSGAEAVKDDNRNPFVSCPASTTAYTPNINVTLPSGWSATNLRVTSITSWDGAAWVDSAACSSSLTLQKVVIEATSPDGRSDESIAVVKRKP